MRAISGREAGSNGWRERGAEPDWAGTGGIKSQLPGKAEAHRQLIDSATGLGRRELFHGRFAFRGTWELRGEREEGGSPEGDRRRGATTSWKLRARANSMGKIMDRTPSLGPAKTPGFHTTAHTHTSTPTAHHGSISRPSSALTTWERELVLVDSLGSAAKAARNIEYTTTRHLPVHNGRCRRLPKFPGYHVLIITGLYRHHAE